MEAIPPCLHCSFSPAADPTPSAGRGCLVPLQKAGYHPGVAHVSATSTPDTATRSSASKRQTSVLFAFPSSFTSAVNPDCWSPFHVSHSRLRKALRDGINPFCAGAEESPAGHFAKWVTLLLQRGVQDRTNGAGPSPGVGTQGLFCNHLGRSNEPGKSRSKPLPTSSFPGMDQNQRDGSDTIRHPSAKAVKGRSKAWEKPIPSTNEPVGSVCVLRGTGVLGMLDS